MKRWAWVVAMVLLGACSASTPVEPVEPDYTVRIVWMQPSDGDRPLDAATRDSLNMEQAYRQDWALNHLGWFLRTDPTIDAMTLPYEASAAAHNPWVFIDRTLDLAPGERAIVYYTGHASDGACGAGEQPVAALYLGTPGCPAALVRRTEHASLGSGFWIWAGLHDLGHTVGAYPSDAPHATSDMHHDQRGYLMFGGGQGVPYRGALPATANLFEPYLEKGE